MTKRQFLSKLTLGAIIGFFVPKFENNEIKNSHNNSISLGDNKTIYSLTYETSKGIPSLPLNSKIITIHNNQFNTNNTSIILYSI